MTFCYSLNFVAWFVLWPFGVFALPALVAAYVPLGVAHGAAAWAGVAAAAAALALYMVAVLHHTSRLRIRSGRAPLALALREPASVADLRAALARLPRGVKPHLVGGGWTHFLQRTGAARSKRIYMTKLRGRVDRLTLQPLSEAGARVRAELGPGGVATTTWLAGTTIAEANRLLAAQGMTLASLPTMAYISVGAWVSTGSHGNAAPGNGGTQEVVAGVHVLPCGAGAQPDEEPREVSYAQARRLFDEEARKKLAALASGEADLLETELAVVAVTLRAVKDVPVVQEMLELRSACDAELWLDGDTGPLGLLKVSEAYGDASERGPLFVDRGKKGPALNRLLFVGSARTYALALKWTRTSVPLEQQPHVDPHTGGFSQVSRFYQADVCSACCGCNEPPHKWEHASTLSYANSWCPWLSPMETLAVVLGSVTNTEFVFRLRAAPRERGFVKCGEGAALWELLQALIQLYATKLKGRAEIRVPQPGLVYMDTSTRGGGDMSLYFALLYKLGVRECALHMGKAVRGAVRAHRRMPGDKPLLVPLGEVHVPSAEATA